MKNKLLITMLGSAVSLVGCNYSDDGYFDTHNNQGGQHSNSHTGQAINEKSFSTQYEVSPTQLQRVDITPRDIIPIATPDTFAFSEIKIEQKGVDALLTNSTPQPVNRFIARIGDDQRLVTIVLDQEIPAYSQARLTSGTTTLEHIKVVNQMRLFTPEVTMIGEDCSLKGPGQACYATPTKEQRQVYETMLTNMHNAFNRKSFLDNLNKYFATPEECQKYDCKSWTDKKLSYSEMAFLKYGSKGHRLSMRVMTAHYAAHGMGGGTSPDITKALSNGGGWASAWWEVVDPKFDSNRPYTNEAYNVIWHEVAHAYGFSHESGMTYGAQASWAWSAITGDKYGKDESYMETHVTEHDRKNVTEMKLPSVLIEKKTLAKNEVMLTFSRPVGEGEDDTIDVDFLSASEVSFQSSYSKGTNSVVLKFSKLPEAPLYVRAKGKKDDYMGTILIQKDDLIPSKTYLIGDTNYKVLADELLNHKANAWDIRNTCKSYGGILAEKAEYQKLWDFLEAHQLIAELPKNVFLSRDEPHGYRVWQLTFGDNAMDAVEVPMGDQLGQSQGIVCLSKRFN